MQSKTFNTIASTTAHGTFPVEITIFYQRLFVSHEFECVATVNGQKFFMNYNVSSAPDDRIQAGGDFSKFAGCDMYQSIRCDAGEVSKFIKGLRRAAAKEAYDFAEFSERKDELDNA